MAADLQEPPELIIQFSKHCAPTRPILSSGAGRSDPWYTGIFANVFWGIYRRFVVKDMPGIIGMSISILFAAVLVVAKLRGDIAVPGYTAIVVSIMFFGGLASLGLGVIGQYLWLCLQNTRNRPIYVVASNETFTPGSAVDRNASVD